MLFPSFIIPNLLDKTHIIWYIGSQYKQPKGFCMPSNEKLVINSDSYEVEVLDGVKYSKAKTFCGKDAGYYINKQGELRATHDNGAQYEYVSWMAFRTWSKLNLDNPVLEKGRGHVSKLAPQNTQTQVTDVPKSRRPGWMSKSAAERHHRQISAYVED